MFTMLLPNFFSQNNICRARFDKKKEKKLTYCLTLLMKKHCSSYCLKGLVHDNAHV